MQTNQATQTIERTTGSSTLNDPVAVKARQKATWESGDYARFATYMQGGAVEIVNGWQLTPGRRVLDVGCGAGQTAIPAAKRGMHMTAIDLATNLIAHARRRAADAGLAIQFDVGDAEALPYESQSFDVAFSLIGAMFAPRPDRVVKEFARVLCPGGTLFMANWTADSMPARMFREVARVVPPPPGVPAPSLWGDERTVRDRLSDRFVDIRLTRKVYPQWDYPMTASELVDFFRAYFGPVRRAFNECVPSERPALHSRLEQVFAEAGTYRNGVLTITDGHYLEIKATRC